MTRKISGYIQSYSIYSVLFFLYLAVFIFIGFFLHLYINHWTLVCAYISYSAIGLIYSIYRRIGYKKLIILTTTLIITVALFWLLTTLFGHTYDTSYDGQDYHQSAVIELSDKWNPIYDKSLPINLTNKVDDPNIEGYGKIIWSIDASIYKLTGKIDSVTALNLIAGLLAVIFVFFALRSLGVDAYPSLYITFIASFTALSVQQIFTLREDAISYYFFLIGVASAVILLKTKKYLPYLLCLITAFIFLAGIKYSNLYLFILLLVLAFWVVLSRKMYRLKSFKLAIAIGLMAGFITLFNPLITNIYRHGAIDYPENLKSFYGNISYEDIPLKIRNDNRLQLFYYGIFSSSITGNAQSPSSNPHLKIPFSTTKHESLVEANSNSKLVGGYGVYFGGVITLSLGAYLYLTLRKKDKTDKKTYYYLSLALGLIVISCLLSLVPNYARFNNQLTLFPIAVIVALLLISGKGRRLGEGLAIGLIFILMINILSDAVYSLSINVQDFKNINTQLSSLKNTDKTYAVYTNDLYSNYIRLEEHGVKIKISKKPISCNNKIILDDSLTADPKAYTELCQLVD